MKTEKTQLTDEFKAKTTLFRTAFLFQLELEDYRERLFECRDEANDVIASIDWLMTALLETS